jgi:hypothetical protein
MDVAVRACEVEASRDGVWPELDGNAASEMLRRLYQSDTVQAIASVAVTTPEGLRPAGVPEAPEVRLDDTAFCGDEAKAVAYRNQVICVARGTVTLPVLVHEVAHSLLWVSPTDDMVQALYRDQQARCPQIVEHDPTWMAVNISLLAACGEVDVAARAEALWTRFATAPDYSQIPAPAIPRPSPRRWRLTDRWLAEAGMAMRGEMEAERAAAGLHLG